MTIQQAAVRDPDREAERRRRILDVAGELFARKGYDTTGVADVAAAARLGAATIYRLIGTKQDLLTEIVLTSLVSAVDGAAAIEPDAPGSLDGLAALALQHRHVGVLWQRDIRHLAAEVQATARDLIRRFAARMREHVRARRPEADDLAVDLLGWAMVATLISPSLHRTEASADEYRQRIAAVLARVLTAPISGDTAPVGPIPAAAAAAVAASAAAPDVAGTGSLLPAVRREALLVAAVHLFAQRGYANVALDDIGALAGVSGPSIYHHFPSKQHLLRTAATRAGAALQATVTSAYVGSADAGGALAALLAGYLRFAFVHHELLSVLITDSLHLTVEDQEQAAEAEREYVGEWVHLLGRLHGVAQDDGRETGLLVDVYAVIDIINNIVRIPRLRAEPAAAGALWTIGRWVLDLA